MHNMFHNTNHIDTRSKILLIMNTKIKIKLTMKSTFNMLYFNDNLKYKNVNIRLRKMQGILEKIKSYKWR